MALVALLVFSVVGFSAALVGFVGFGLTFSGAVVVYLGMSVLGPLCVVPVAHALSNILGLESQGATPA